MYNSREAAVDDYQRLYQERMSLEADVKFVKAQEEEVKRWLIAEMEKDKLPVLLGKEWLVNLVKGVTAKLDDYDSFTRYVAQHRRQGAFGLLYRRINQDTVRDWSGMTLNSDGVILIPRPIPGLGAETFTKLHHSRRTT